MLNFRFGNVVKGNQNYKNLDKWMHYQKNIKERYKQISKMKRKKGPYVPENARIPAVKSPPNCPKKT